MSPERSSARSNYRQVRRLVYIDSDPVFTQVKLARGQTKFRKRVNAHDVHFSFGECLPGTVPTTGHCWRATRTPIVLSEWRPAMPRREVFTTVMNWTSYEPLKYSRHIYGQKDVEFERFIELPSKVHPTVIEVALSKLQHLNWQTDDRACRLQCSKSSATRRTGPRATCSLIWAGM